MMAPSDSESGSTRKWRWFKKGEREEVKLKARTSSVEKVGEKGQEGLKDNFTVEGFNKKNVNGDEARKNCTNDTTRDICENLLNDLLFEIDNKEYLRENGSNPSKSFDPSNVNQKTSKQNAVGPLGERVGCQGCGTERVHECEDEGEGEDMMTQEEKVEKNMMTKEEKVGEQSMNALVSKLVAMNTTDNEMVSSETDEEKTTSEIKGGDSLDKILNKLIIGEEEFGNDLKEVKGDDEFESEVEQKSSDLYQSRTVSDSDECEKITLNIIEEMLDKVCGMRGQAIAMPAMSKEERVKKYLEFVRLWVAAKPGEESQKRRDANLVWKQKIEDGQSVSEVNYLEQAGFFLSSRKRNGFWDYIAWVRWRS